MDVASLNSRLEGDKEEEEEEEDHSRPSAKHPVQILAFQASSLSLLSSLELSDTKIYEPSIRALLETAAHLCEVAVLELRTPSP